MRSSLLAAAALALVVSEPVVAGLPDVGYLIPKRYSPASRNGNNRREESAKRHAKAKAAYRSKRAQRKATKR